MELRINPPIELDLPVSSNPSPQQAFTGLFNALLSGTSRSVYAPDLLGALSIKAVLAGSVTWETGGHRYVVRENSYLVVNQRQAYTFTIDSATPSTTLSVFFQHGFVEEVHRALTQPDSALMDAPGAERPAPLMFRQRLEPEPSGVLARLRALHAARLRGKTSRTATEEAFLRIAHASSVSFRVLKKPRHVCRARVLPRAKSSCAAFFEAAIVSSREWANP